MSTGVCRRRGPKLARVRRRRPRPSGGWCLCARARSCRPDRPMALRADVSRRSRIHVDNGERERNPCRDLAALVLGQLPTGSFVSSRPALRRRDQACGARFNQARLLRLEARGSTTSGGRPRVGGRDSGAALGRGELAVEPTPSVHLLHGVARDRDVADLTRNGQDCLESPRTTCSRARAVRWPREMRCTASVRPKACTRLCGLDGSFRGTLRCGSRSATYRLRNFRRRCLHRQRNTRSGVRRPELTRMISGHTGQFCVLPDTPARLYGKGRGSRHREGTSGPTRGMLVRANHVPGPLPALVGNV